MWARATGRFGSEMHVATVTESTTLPSGTTVYWKNGPNWSSRVLSGPVNSGNVPGMSVMVTVTGALSAVGGISTPDAPLPVTTVCVVVDGKTTATTLFGSDGLVPSESCEPSRPTLQ